MPGSHQTQQISGAEPARGRPSRKRSGSPRMKATAKCWIKDPFDAILLFMGIQTGRLQAILRRPPDTERSELIRSGSVFIFSEPTSGIKRWTDGHSWSPSRILDSFLVYRELDSKVPAGSKKRTLRARDGNGQSVSQRSANISRDPNYQVTEMDRSLVGSLIDSYDFLMDGLVKKTLTLTWNDESHHIISYYNINDVKAGVLQPASKMIEYNTVELTLDDLSRLRFKHPAQEITIAIPAADHDRALTHMAIATQDIAMARCYMVHQKLAESMVPYPAVNTGLCMNMAAQALDPGGAHHGDACDPASTHYPPYTVPLTQSGYAQAGCDFQGPATGYQPAPLPASATPQASGPHPPIHGQPLGLQAPGDYGLASQGQGHLLSLQKRRTTQHEEQAPDLPDPERSKKRTRVEGPPRHSWPEYPGSNAFNGTPGPSQSAEGVGNTIATSTSSMPPGSYTVAQVLPGQVAMAPNSRGHYATATMDPAHMVSNSIESPSTVATSMPGMAGMAPSMLMQSQVDSNGNVDADDKGLLQEMDRANRIWREACEELKIPLVAPPTRPVADHGAPIMQASLSNSSMNTAESTDSKQTQSISPPMKNDLNYPPQQGADLPHDTQGPSAMGQMVHGQGPMFGQNVHFDSNNNGFEPWLLPGSDAQASWLGCHSNYLQTSDYVLATPLQDRPVGTGWQAAVEDPNEQVPDRY